MTLRSLRHTLLAAATLSVAGVGDARAQGQAARPVASIARWTTPVGVDALSTDLATILASGTRSGRWGVLVASVSRGDTIFASSPDDMMQPASIMKVMTAALALERLGPDHRFTTDVLRDGSLSGGVLQGNLYLRGGGDPSLSDRFYKRAGTTPMDSLARLVAAAGIRRVRGDIVADDGAFEPQRIPDGWNPRNLGYSYAAPVAALSLNENVVWVVVEPQGSRASVTLEPASTTVPIANTVRVVAGSRTRITVRRTPEGGLAVSGSAGRAAGQRKFAFVIADPVSFAGGALRAALQRAGVTVEGTVRTGETPGQAQALVRLPSLPLAQLVTTMNGESNNHFAELVFRNAVRGADGGTVGSARAAERALHEFLRDRAGIERPYVAASDGSGLSENDRLTARVMVELLGYAHNAPWGSTLHASLPVAGDSETLRRRMRQTPAEGNLHAKTGTTNTVASLAGYVTARNGEVLAFAFIYNGSDRWRARDTMDRMGATLAEFVR